MGAFLTSFLTLFESWRDLWFPLLTKPQGLVIHIVGFVVIGMVIRKLAGLRYEGDDARIDATRGMSVTMYLALFVGLLDLKSIHVLLNSGIAIVELFIAVLYGFVQECTAFVKHIKSRRASLIGVPASTTV